LTKLGFVGKLRVQLIHKIDTRLTGHTVYDKKSVSIDGCPADWNVTWTDAAVENSKDPAQGLDWSVGVNPTIMSCNSYAEKLIAFYLEKCFPTMKKYSSATPRQ
jgi:hypothetical protein